MYVFIRSILSIQKINIAPYIKRNMQTVRPWAMGKVGGTPMNIQIS